MSDKTHSGSQDPDPSADDSHNQMLEEEDLIIKACINGALTSAKLPADVKTVLDVGVGSSFWAASFAAEYPGTEVVGLHTKQVVGKHTKISNLRFQVGDIEQPWAAIPDDSQDFVHIQNCSGTVREWEALCRRAFQALKPGGVLEMTELRGRLFDFEGNFNETTVAPEFETVYHELAEQQGLDVDPAESTPSWLALAGFERIVQRTEMIPLGDWAKDNMLRSRGQIMNGYLAKYDPWYLNFANTTINKPELRKDPNIGVIGIGHLPMKVFLGSGWSMEDFVALMKKVTDQVTKSKTYVTVAFTTAKKPAEE